ncbi:MAG: major capsid protein [Planctomycetota bacterium]|jgi:hypothetical protein
MPEGIITTGQNPNAIATIVAKRALARLKAATVAVSIADASYESEVRSHGDTVNVPIPAEYTTNLLADGGTINRQQTSLGNASLVLSQHRELSFEITDRNEALSRPDIRGTNLGQAIANFAEDVDEDLLSIYASFSTTDVGAYNTALTEAVIDSGETTLFDQRVSAGLRKSLVLTGSGYSQVRQIPRFTESDKIAQGSRPIADGFVGRIKGMDVYRDQKVNVTSGPARQAGRRRHDPGRGNGGRHVRPPDHVVPPRDPGQDLHAGSALRLRLGADQLRRRGPALAESALRSSPSRDRRHQPVRGRKGGPSGFPPTRALPRGRGRESKWRRPIRSDSIARSVSSRRKKVSLPTTSYTCRC